jgi:23S rRNA (adenine-N6)-dimethyltransferase
VAGRRARTAPRAPTRGRSQHFLRSPALAEAIVREAAITPDDVVVDIGAGSGRLTRPLAQRAGTVYAVEVDPHWAAVLRRKLGRRANVTVVEGDGLQVSLPSVPFRVVANLPFDATTALLRRLLECPHLDRADVIVEWDVACKRASCWPSTALGVCWGARYEFTLVRRIPAACFEPRPSVDAGLLRVVRRVDPLVRGDEYASFCRFVRAAFQAGRLRDVCRGAAWKRAARELGVQPTAKPRDLDLHQWAALFAAVAARRDRTLRNTPE